jgi:nucleoside-diphosphate-sugar epimerase
MRILITGASGLIGGALLDRLRGENHHVICQSRFTHENEPNIKWIKHDLITDSWSRVSLPNIDIVYHLASQTSSYRARLNPINDLSVNVLGLLNLLEHFKKKVPCPFFVIAGTATEVGLVEQLPIHENLPDRPITFYDISKLSAEMYLKQYVREGWLKGCALRFSNVFGRSKVGQQTDRGVIDKVFNQAVTGKSITIYGDGSYIRDYIFIDDVVSALIFASQYREETNGRNFLIGSGQGVTIKDAFLKVIDLAAEVTGVHVNYEHMTPPTDLSDIEYRNAVIDSSEFKNATGWFPQYDFESGLNAAYSSTIKNNYSRWSR